MKMKRLFIKMIIIIFFGIGQIQAQDLHYSQFHAAPLNVNPSLTGLFNGDIRWTGNFRSQWLSVPVPYTTFSVGYDQKIFTGGNLSNSGFGAGFVINYDEAGDSELSLMQVNPSISYSQQVNKRNFVSIGLSAGVGQRRIKTTNLTFDEQFIDGTFSPDNAITEIFPNTSFGFIDISAGLTWQVILTNRLKFNLGGSVWHLNQPKFSFLEDDESFLQRKVGINMDATIQLSPTLDILPSAIYFIQGAYHERIFGAYWKYYIDARKGLEKAILIGTWYRMNDAAIASVGMDYDFWRASISYDWNTSDFNTATRGRGGYELAFQYIISKVKIIADQKACPIF
ncbi:MAG: PorP/SprF family type IX secretion system membrane protein [Saprospiraceae bacterium]